MLRTKRIVRALEMSMRQYRWWRRRFMHPRMINMVRDRGRMEGASMRYELPVLYLRIRESRGRV